MTNIVLKWPRESFIGSNFIRFAQCLTLIISGYAFLSLTSSPVMNADLSICPVSKGQWACKLSPPPYQWPIGLSFSPKWKQSLGLTEWCKDCQNKLKQEAKSDNVVFPKLRMHFTQLEYDYINTIEIGLL